MQAISALPPWIVSSARCQMLLIAFPTNYWSITIGLAEVAGFKGDSTPIPWAITISTPLDFDITLRQPWDNVGQQFESFCDGSSHQFTANRFYEALYPLRGVQILWRVFGAIRFPHRTEMFNKALTFVFKKISYEKELFSISNCYKKIQLAIFFVFHKLT